MPLLRSAPASARSTEHHLTRTNMAKKIEGYAPTGDYDVATGIWVFKDRTTDNPCTLVIHDGPSERVYTESEVRAAAMAEPELPGDMPDEMWEACRSDRATMQEAMRVVVRLTRDGILERIGITL